MTTRTPSADHEHTCHGGMNPPHPYPCKACEVESAADRERAAFMAGRAALYTGHAWSFINVDSSRLDEAAYTAWLATQRGQTR
jgi:hypothetical protein